MILGQPLSKVEIVFLTDGYVVMRFGGQVREGFRLLSIQLVNTVTCAFASALALGNRSMESLLPSLNICKLFGGIIFACAGVRGFG